MLAAGSTGVTLAQSLGIVGTSLDTAGYSAARAILVTSSGALAEGLMIAMFQITDPDPSCGLSDWDEVLADYSGLECGAIRGVFIISSKDCST